MAYKGERLTGWVRKSDIRTGPPPQGVPHIRITTDRAAGRTRGFQFVEMGGEDPVPARRGATTAWDRGMPQNAGSRVGEGGVPNEPDSLPSINVREWLSSCEGMFDLGGDVLAEEQEMEL